MAGDEKYRLTLEGSDIDEALLRLANYEDEGLVLGSRKGVMLGPESEYYHKNARYYAELAQSAVPGDTTSAVRWDIDQSALTDADRELARKNIRAGGSNRNLLDNGWFTVRQRGDGPFTGALNTVDRWKTTNSRSILTGYSGYVTLSMSASGNGFLRQYLATSYSGTYTFSAYVRGSGSGYIAVNANDSGLTVLASKSFSNVGNDWTLVSGTFTTIGTPISIFSFRADDGTSIDIKCAKLEPGTVSTLPNDVPPDYGEELAKCMWYFVRLKGDPVGVGYVGSALTTAYIHLFTPIMRAVTPTITYSGAFYIRGLGFSGPVTAMSAGSPASNAGGVSVRCTMSNSPSQVQACAMYCNTASDYIDISAEP